MTGYPKLPNLPTFCRGPFSVNNAMWIVGSDEYGGSCHVADIRGWGYLTGKGQALALSSEAAVAAQARTAQFIADAMNEKMQRDGAITDSQNEDSAPHRVRFMTGISCTYTIGDTAFVPTSAVEDFIRRRGFVLPEELSRGITPRQNVQSERRPSRQVRRALERIQKDRAQ